MLGLHLNHHKTELICEESAGGQLLQVAPDLHKVNPKEAVLLESPIGESTSIDAAITSRVEALKIMGHRLPHFRKHDALILLCHSFAIPKILYILRTVPCLSSPCLESFDQELHSIVSAVFNISLEGASTWSQAMQPVGFVGLGIRRAVQLAPSAFLASAAGCKDLIVKILPRQVRSSPYPAIEAAWKEWSGDHDQSPPPTPTNIRQKAWDKPRVHSTFKVLLETASDPRARARLLATTTKESGAWLHALPISSLGLRMDDEVLRIAVGLHLGVPLCQPHNCYHCGAAVDEWATHGLSCPKSQGRHPRHTAINELIQRSLVTAGVAASGTMWYLSIQWEETRWFSSNTLEVWSSPRLGCHMPRHLRPITCDAGHK